MADTNQPAVRQEDIFALLRQYAPAWRLQRERDLLSGRYQILPAQPLAELNTAFAKAYAVRDAQAPDAALYALVFASDAPLRQKTIQALRELRHPSLIALLDEGMAEISTLSEQRYV